jgi:hypothetical protein
LTPRGTDGDGNRHHVSLVCVWKHGEVQAETPQRWGFTLDVRAGFQFCLLYLSRTAPAGFPPPEADTPPYFRFSFGSYLSSIFANAWGETGLVT